jgi:hypothetical protein
VILSSTWTTLLSSEQTTWTQLSIATPLLHMGGSRTVKSWAGTTMVGHGGGRGQGSTLLPAQALRGGHHYRRTSAMAVEAIHKMRERESESSGDELSCL